MKAIQLLALMLALSGAFYYAPVAHAASQQSPLFYVSSYWGYNTTVITAYPGATALPLTIRATYAGPVTLYNVTMVVKPRFPIVPIKGEPNASLFLPELTPGTSVGLVGLYNVSGSASLGVYNETLSIVYYAEVEVPQVGPTLVRGQEEVNFSVPITGYSGIKLVSYRTTPAVIYAGDTAGVLTVYLVNNGNAVASDLTVTATFSSPLSQLYPGSNSIYLAYLPPGRIINISFPFSIENYSTSKLVRLPGGTYIESSAPASFNSTVKIAVSTSSGNYTFFVPVSVVPAAHFVVVQSYYPKLTAGGSSYVTLQLSNIGGAESRFTTLTLLMGPVFTQYASSSENPLIAVESINQTVGDVEPGQSFNATFVISVASNIPPGTYYMPVLISWRQEPTMAPMYQIVKVPLVVSSSSLIPFSDGISTTWLYIIAIIVIAVLVALVFARRKK